MTDKILQKYKRELVLSKSKRIVFFMLWLLLLCLAGFLYLINNSIIGFLISVILAHEIWKKLVKINRKTRILKMVVYIRKIELKQLEIDTDHPYFKEIKKIFTPNNK
jgi:hypothetical protein